MEGEAEQTLGGSGIGEGSGQEAVREGETQCVWLN